MCLNRRTSEGYGIKQTVDASSLERLSIRIRSKTLDVNPTSKVFELILADICKEKTADHVERFEHPTADKLPCSPAKKLKKTAGGSSSPAPKKQRIEMTACSQHTDNGAPF
jgi:hypothetical protein